MERSVKLPNQVYKIGNLLTIGLSAPPPGCVLCLPGLSGDTKTCDRSPYSNIGTITGAVWVVLASGLWVLEFDGSDDYVDCGNDGSLKLGAGELTLMSWVKTTGSDGSIIDKLKSSLNYSGYWLRVAGGKAEGAATDCGTGACGWGTTKHPLTGTSIINNDVWHHLAFTRKGAEQAIYVDAICENTQSEGPWDTDHDTSLGIGKRTWAGGVSFGGLVALPRVYRRALSALEITRCYQEEKYFFGVCR